MFVGSVSEIRGLDGLCYLGDSAYSSKSLYRFVSVSSPQTDRIQRVVKLVLCADCTHTRKVNTSALIMLCGIRCCELFCPDMLELICPLSWYYTFVDIDGQSLDPIRISNVLALNVRDSVLYESWLLGRRIQTDTYMLASDKVVNLTPSLTRYNQLNDSLGKRTRLIVCSYKRSEENQSHWRHNMWWRDVTIPQSTNPLKKIMAKRRIGGSCFRFSCL